MQMRALWWLPLVVSAAWWAPAWAAPASAADVPALDARAWLERLRGAATQRNYQGTMVFTAGAVVSSSRVGHFCVADQSYERVEALDGRQQRIYRHNDLVHTFWPASRVATVERSAAVQQPVVLPEVDPRLQEHYELRVIGSDRLAGRAAHVLLLSPRDEYRFAQRLWADAATGLMLRADVLGPDGTVLESSAFSDIEIGGRPLGESVLGPMMKLDGYRVVTVSPSRTQLDREGWALTSVPPGFRLVGCVRRTIGDPVPQASTRPGDVLQAVFSDGLTRVSVFIEPNDPARARQSLLTHMGATHTLMKPLVDRWWVTVMGDVPAATLKRFAGALERRP